MRKGKLQAATSYGFPVSGATGTAKKLGSTGGSFSPHHRKIPYAGTGLSTPYGFQGSLSGIKYKYYSGIKINNSARYYKNKSYVNSERNKNVARCCSYHSVFNLKCVHACSYFDDGSEINNNNNNNSNNSFYIFHPWVVYTYSVFY